MNDTHTTGCVNDIYIIKQFMFVHPSIHPSVGTFLYFFITVNPTVIYIWYVSLDVKNILLTS